MSKKGAFVYQQIELTTAEWATNTTLYPASTWLFERLESGTFNMKLADGVHSFAELPAVMQDITATVKTSNETTYILTLTTAAGVFDTPNLKGQNGKDAATVAIDPDTKHMVIGGVDTGVKVEGVDGKSAFELWQGIEGNADKTLVDFYVYLKGEKGNAFTFDDFTIEQLALLKGASAYQVWKAQPGNENMTVDEYLLYIKGAPFTYADFTPEQIIAITGKSAYQIWLDQPGNEGKTIEQYLIAIKGQDGQSAYLDAVAKGYAGTKDEFDTLLAGIEGGGVYMLPMSFASLDNSFTSEQISLAIGGVEGWNTLKEVIQSGKSVVAISGGAEGYYGIMPSPSSVLGTEGDIETIQLLFDLRGGSVIYSLSKTIVTNVFTVTAESATFIQTEEGKTLTTNDFTDTDKQRVDKAIVPTDVFTVSSLASLSNTKYSQIYTYTSATAQPINFSATPAEGFECMLDIKNSTASNITQAIPNASGWQTEDTSVVLPAGKITSISIRRVHGINVVKA